MALVRVLLLIFGAPFDAVGRNPQNVRIRQATLHVTVLAFAVDEREVLGMFPAKFTRNQGVQAVHERIIDRGLPAVSSGSYYVKAFQLTGPTPERLSPLTRDGLVRLCLKPPQT